MELTELPEWEHPAPGVARLRLPGWDCTAGLVRGEDAALLVDPGACLAQGGAVRRAAERLLGDGSRVTHLALTHPHFDHVLGAPAVEAPVYAAVGAESLLGTEAGRAELREDAVRHGLDPAEARRAAASLRGPDQPVSGEFALDLGGGRRVLLANVGPGHSGHDLVLVVPGERTVVFCGDLVEESGEPQAGPDAVPARWPEALDRLLGLGGDEAVYVPGHGALVDAAFVRRQRDALARRFGVS
ncbi:MBL fold metallo-hydrolase [Streptomyces evansiae]|uniref:MBL fold metallo-hydrolase n=1 Tax=Streptomyces evansiae TaxID=3075535 RepID=UPI0028870FAE|nr:MBL fold metallo-hydrolase [Streptomyces sp. DSM 41859]MDT0423247.1 MBL fold metallo-hydrolase [Streptomyces sp. DSM 41859]